jgi:hypothetical protein
MLDLAIAYRIYPRISKVPAIFPDDKFQLSALCLHSFKKALGDLKIKIWVLLDGCPEEYGELFRNAFTPEELELIHLDKVGNLATFSMQIDLLVRQTEAPFVYFAEDDYFYFPDAIVKMLEFARGNPSADFVTAYDHSDLYTLSYSRERHLIKAFGDCHWRTLSSTCLTFLASKKALLQSQHTLRTYSRGNNDCSMWLVLTQKAEILNFRVHWHDVQTLKIWLLAVRWGLMQVLFGRRYKLWSPLPTAATHMESPCLAPLIDWKREFDLALAEMQSEFAKATNYSESL